MPRGTSLKKCLGIPFGDISLRSITQGAPVFVGPLPPPELVASRPGLGSLSHLPFYGPSHFRDGNVHSKFYVCSSKVLPISKFLLEIVRNKVRIEHFPSHSKGNFKGKAYDSNVSKFVSDTVLLWVTAGVIAVWGPVDGAVPPRLVLPLTVEPTKPRLCHDKRY